jgi:putative phosphoserine phosphatase/1-acylglycerol-3-phosphate O-acyltransferase
MAREVRPVHVLRTFLTLVVILPGLLAGAWTLLATRNRRRALDRAIDLWGTWGCRAAGITLRVDGAERLERVRPAVFVINHQSGIDPILVCALLRHGFVGVAKAEIRRNPLLGPAFAFAGTVFVDRTHTPRALAALETAAATLRGGISVAVAPEGTRSPGHAVGSFKKGAFRLAMAAGVPIVPVVILNSADVLPRRHWIMTPATVRVAVQPPVPTTDWRLETLDDHIAAVRRIFLETLPPPRPEPAGVS